MNEEQILELAKQYGSWNGQTLELNDAGIIEFACAIIRNDQELNECRKLAITQGRTIESMKQQLSILKPIQAKQSLAMQILEKAKVIERFDNNTVTVSLIEDWFTEFELMD